MDPTSWSLLRQFGLEGKVALVTGGGSGIGLGIARVFASAGARVALLGRSAERLADAVADLPGEALAVPADVRDPAAVERAVAAVRERWDAIDVLVNNAGGAFSDDYRHGPLLEVEPQNFTNALATNLVGAHVVARATVPAMLERGGAVVNIASVAGRQGATPFPGLGFHAAGKAGLIRLTSVMAAEWAPRVRVNAIAPGYVATARLEAGIDAGNRASTVARTALRRAGTPHDIGAAALFLASDAAGWITGVTLDVDGGLLGAGTGQAAS
ncbi:SDR family NAD(P)-dependent oxidoreductase [Conexibacter sp. CPCC 206217]|uniref:SDR family NAD(P)-dependent oxidoreductase n=1 Tax=Conexibacter sp. CPCC 206217 TaxID=3064574 RepID=UPI002722B803|nr:glucose 1-dehydrogenase [Conexibacter sp. CPCC 206217]MDO8212136.1 glucose 1-dehydrogenase [Conexibacter sp. CPCC 206217]